MRYQHTVEIQKPIQQVSALFQNMDNMQKWQEGLKSHRHLSGTPGQPGAKMELKYEMGKRKVEMIETIIANELPTKFDAIYEAKGVYNKNFNRFESAGPNSTRWTMDTEFDLKGVMKLFAFLFPGMFKKQTAKMMNDFKRFAESSN